MSIRARRVRSSAAAAVLALVATVTLTTPPGSGEIGCALRRSLGAPRFDEAAVQVSDRDVALSIEVRR